VLLGGLYQPTTPMESDMSNEVNFRKVGNTWMVVSTEPLTAGDTVPVTLKSGNRKPVKLGRLVGYVYTIEGERQEGNTRRNSWEREGMERDYN